jgi:hypothetical protein
MLLARLCYRLQDVIILFSQIRVDLCNNIMWYDRQVMSLMLQFLSLDSPMMLNTKMSIIPNSQRRVDMVTFKHATCQNSV